MRWLLALLLALTPCAASAQLTFMPPMVAQDLVQIAVPSSGDTIVPAQGVTVLLINTTGLIAILTVNLPANPQDGQRWMVASGAAITVLNIGGGTVRGLATGLSANGYARFIYSAQAGAWFRTG